MKQLFLTQSCNRRGASMNRKIRFLIAAIVTLAMLIAGTTAWAVGTKQSSLGPIINHMGQSCNTTINMGDATFTMTIAGKQICNFEVTRLKIPNAEMGGAPEGLEYRSDGFEVVGPDDKIGILEVCFAYSPQDED